MTGYTAWGIDFSFGSGLTTAQMKANGTQFVCRYLSGGSAKDIDGAELANYRAAGIAVVLVWETTGVELTEAQGATDARAADAQARGLGLDGIPLYFAEDVPPTAQTETDMRAYMAGVKAQIGYGRAGLYGGYASIADYFDAALGAYGWQTYAWSNGLWDYRAQLQQYQNGAVMGPAAIDRDRALATDYGQTPRPAGAVNPVSGLHVTSTGWTGVDLAWEAPPGATGYTVKAYEGSGAVREYATTVPAVRVRDLEPGHKYTVRVRAHPGASTGADASIDVATR